MSKADNTVVPFRIADAARRIRHVFVRDLMLDGHIGIHAHEQGVRQRLRINLDLSVSDHHPLPADQIEHVVCYQQVVEATTAVVNRGHVNLVETLAEEIAQTILGNNQVITVRVRVEKLDAFANVASVGVEIERTSA
ncbi:dihydroneopterin aldolase [Iodidimonas sp. SYSU 1G8]|uniref:dihydroneopterin aldolase n=1 Tax=Iodidimonas sp. SYSU 1G8 TaxID=3133967 RepID=UPI0031FED012